MLLAKILLGVAIFVSILGIAAWPFSPEGPGAGLAWAAARTMRKVLAVLVVLGGLALLSTGLDAGYLFFNHVTVKYKNQVTVKYKPLLPSAKCDAGTLRIEGSTAFAPIMTMAATEYQQLCPQAQITVTGNGSGQGLSDLEFGTNPPDIAMYDGVPQNPVVRGFEYKKVGDVIMAMVGYDGPDQGKYPLPDAIFRQGPGMGLTPAAITQAFVDGGDNIPGIPGIPVQSLGRAMNSGTREAFIEDVAGGDTAANGTLKPSSDSTLDLLSKVNTTPDLIGYAEADALPYFPNVREIAINGWLPTRANALDGHYTFLATERLYTNGPPTGLAADLISFLTSAAENNQLQGTSFIGCAGLAGSAALRGSC